MKLHILLILSLLAFKPLLSQKTIHVPSDYGTIQIALNQSQEHDTIIVAPGTYFENLNWPQAKDLHLIGAEGPDSTIIDGSNTTNVVRMFDLTEASLLKGFTIQNGFSTLRGAGIEAHSCGVKLSHLKITNNIVSGNNCSGGGAYLDQYSGDIASCDFIGNTINAQSTSRGGGLAAITTKSIVIIDCNFIDNDSTVENPNSNLGGEGRGGGLYILSESPNSFSILCLISKCNFQNNTLTNLNSEGAGIHVLAKDGLLELRIDSSQIIKNQSEKGGGIYLRGVINLHLFDSDISENSGCLGSALYFNAQLVLFGSIIINNTRINNNTALLIPEEASAIYIAKAEELIIVNSEISYNQGYCLQNLTLIGNTTNVIHSTLAYNQYSVYVESRTNLILKESILWENGNAEIIMADNSFDINIDITNSIVKGGYQGTNVIDSDPLFISETELIPSENSPCLNAGSPSSITDDLNGNPRPMPFGSKPDIGAYEIDQPFESITSLLLSKKTKVYPNPTHDWVFFSDIIDEVKIYNIDGRQLGTYQSTSGINLQEFPSGSYTLVIVDNDKKQEEKLMIVK